MRQAATGDWVVRRGRFTHFKLPIFGSATCVFRRWDRGTNPNSSIMVGNVQVPRDGSRRHP